MARIKKNRIVQQAPHFCGFKPMGCSRKNAEEISLTFEEYEAINLCDYELLSQADAADMMNISRPTLTRIYESARRKIAKALMEGCIIRFEPGNAEVARWYSCNHCRISFTQIDGMPIICPFCKTSDITEKIQPA